MKIYLHWLKYSKGYDLFYTVHPLDQEKKIYNEENFLENFMLWNEFSTLMVLYGKICVEPLSDSKGLNFSCRT